MDDMKSQRIVDNLNRIDITLEGILMCLTTLDRLCHAVLEEREGRDEKDKE